jgi:hypothetical protein
MTNDEREIKRKLRVLKRADELGNAMGFWSAGEIIIAKFFAGLWLHKNNFDFDLFEAASTLDSHNRSIITEWLLDPFWP